MSNNNKKLLRSLELCSKDVSNLLADPELPAEFRQNLKRLSDRLVKILRVSAEEASSNQRDFRVQAQLWLWEFSKWIIQFNGYLN